MAIYTKKGDRGETSLYDEETSKKKRISKESAIVHALGCLDELNSSIGVALSFCENKKREEDLKEVQKDILKIGSIIAGSKLRFTKSRTKRLEKIIDKLEGDLPVLKNFILPGGTKFAAHLHFSRSMARRTERGVVSLSKKTEVKPQILTYVNRLSDFLFMLAREDNHINGVSTEVWIGKKK